MNQEKLEKLFIEVLGEIGENPSRIGLQETPKRIAKMYKELFRGYDVSQKPKITVFPNGEDSVAYNQMITDTGNFYSMCEHHMITFSGFYWFAYIPSMKGKLIGLSKVARVVDFHSAKLQIQERLTNDIVEELWNALSKDCEPPLGMALVMKGEHLCKTMRGAKKKGTMTTSVMKGVFLNPDKNKNPKDEFLSLINIK